MRTALRFEQWVNCKHCIKVRVDQIAAKPSQHNCFNFTTNSDIKFALITQFSVFFFFNWVCILFWCFYKHTKNKTHRHRWWTSISFTYCINHYINSNRLSFNPFEILQICEIRDRHINRKMCYGFNHIWRRILKELVESERFVALFSLWKWFGATKKLIFWLTSLVNDP